MGHARSRVTSPAKRESREHGGGNRQWAIGNSAEGLAAEPDPTYQSAMKSCKNGVHHPPRQVVSLDGLQTRLCE
jgi:hypothetical protein